MLKPFVEKRQHFPDPSQSYADGLLAITEELNLDLLLEAYSFGIFPWPHEETPILWFCPEKRGLLFFDDLKIAKSLQKKIKNSKWQFTFNKSFNEVIENCARSARAHQSGTWINSQMKAAYQKFHAAGYAHSVEVWEDDELIGGLYGVYVGGVFSGESMFFKRSDASKFALVKLVETLKAAGFTWLDAQSVSPNMELLGARYVSKAEYFRMMTEAKLSIKKLPWVT